MNKIEKLYCRTFQFCFKIVKPILPYRDPILLNKIGEIINVLEKDDITNVLIVTDKNLLQIGLLNELLAILDNNLITYHIYDKTVVNPTSNNVHEATNLYLENNCKSIIAFGGGSPLDCAKGVAGLIATKKKDIKKLKGLLKIRKKTPNIFAIPTTCGTGSETTLTAVITDSTTRLKYTINDFAIIPRYAYLDHNLLTNLPPSLVATTGMDALTHAIEAFIGKSNTKKTKEDAINAIKIIINNIEDAYNGDLIAKEKMLYASHIAGRAFSKAYVGYVHAIAHSLGGMYNIPHGYANATLLPVTLRFYGNCIYKKLAYLAKECNLVSKDSVTSYSALVFISKIEELNNTFLIPSYFKQLKREDINSLASLASKEANPLYPVPRLLNSKSLREIYLKVAK